jgi:hypothetical protein
MIKIEFRPIDCKSDGYCPVYVHDKTYNQVSTPHNIRLQAELEKEYLVGLKGLQDRLRAKYESQFTKEKEKDKLRLRKAGWQDENQCEAIKKEVWGDLDEDDFSDLYYT